MSVIITLRIKGKIDLYLKERNGSGVSREAPAPFCEGLAGKFCWSTHQTYVKIKGQWNYLYRDVDKEGNTVDFYLSRNRDKSAAEAFFRESIGDNPLPEKVGIDKSRSNKAALDSLN